MVVVSLSVAAAFRADARRKWPVPGNHHDQARRENKETELAMP
jgi:hypothetical protein